jgi:protein-S-isoprenylcysteine O-methyltransferase Ste14
MTTPRPKGKTLSLLRGFKNLLGAGIHLLVAGFLLEALTIVIRQRISFPVLLPVGVRIALTFPCVLLCLVGMIWFNGALNLVKTHLLDGENKLITDGPFNYVRHPLYATVLMMLPPLLIIWYADILFIIPWAVLLIIAHYVVLIEERGLVKTFGEDYERYRKYVPALLPYKGAGGRRYREHSDSIALEESSRGAANTRCT